MNGAIRQNVTVQQGGVIHFSSPELIEGTQAEVIVLPSSLSVSGAASGGRLAAFQALQRSMALMPAAAEKWSKGAATEREAFGPQ